MCCNHLQGAFSFLFLFPDRIEACRDPWGFRPLVIGQTRDGFYCVASETCALTSIQATYVREVEPGEIVTIDKSGTKFDEPVFHGDSHQQPCHCAFEHVYFASPSSNFFGDVVMEVRQRMGRQLARRIAGGCGYCDSDSGFRAVGGAGVFEGIGDSV